jgi:DNA replication protein DnaC
VRRSPPAKRLTNERARLKAAGFPAPKTLDGFDIKASSLPRATFEFLASLEWLDHKDNLCLAGPAGVGKSHLAQALGRGAIAAGRKVRFFQADQLIEALYRGLADNTVGKLIERLLRHDFIVIDDLGFTVLDRVAAGHLFRFIAAAYEQRSVAITTNVEFERWTQFLPDAATATAILDRFLHHCHVIALDGESFRLREARELVTPA